MYNYPKLEESLETEIVILGGGISGALVAYYLSKGGFKCVVVDERNIGMGSSCASTSLLQYELDVPLVKLQKQVGYKNAVRAYELCVQSILKLQDIAGDIEKIDAKVIKGQHLGDRGSVRLVTRIYPLERCGYVRAL